MPATISPTTALLRSVTFIQRLILASLINVHYRSARVRTSAAGPGSHELSHTPATQFQSAFRGAPRNSWRRAPRRQRQRRTDHRLTTILGHDTARAYELAAASHQRWEQETASEPKPQGHAKITNCIELVTWGGRLRNESVPKYPGQSRLSPDVTCYR